MLDRNFETRTRKRKDKEGSNGNATTKYDKAKQR